MGGADKPVCGWVGLPTDLFVQHSFRQEGFLMNLIRREQRLLNSRPAARSESRQKAREA
jgi:hypothetical protein